MASLEYHPVWKSIQAFNGKDDAQARLAFKVYMDLTEVKGWWNVKTHFCEELGFVFVSGHGSRTKPREIILPVSTDSSFSPAQLQQYLQCVRLPEYDTDGLVLGLSSQESGTVYYRISDGLVPPESPELTEWKKYRREELPQLQRHHVGQQTSQYLQKHGLLDTDR